MKAKDYIFVLMPLWGMFGFTAVFLTVSQCARRGPAEEAARTAMYVVEALCSDDMTVKECRESLETQARFLDNPDGGTDAY